MNKNLTTTNQNAKLALTKSKKLLNITKNLLEDEDTNSIFIIQKFFINKLILDDSEIKDKYFVSNADGKTIKIFDLSTGLLIKELEDSVNNLAFFKISKNKDLMITYNYEEKAQLWNLNTGKLYKEFLLNFTTITFSDSEELIAYGEDNLIVLWDVKKEKIIKKINKHLSPIKLIKFIKQDTIILSKSQDNKIIIWEIDTENNIAVIDSGKMLNNRYISIQNNEETKIYDIEELEYKITIPTISKIDICNDDNFLLTFNKNTNSIIVYSLVNRNEIYNIDLKDSEDEIFTEFSTDRKYLLICNNTKHEITIYNLETGAKIISNPTNYWIETAFLSFDNSQYAFIDSENEIHVVELMSNKPVKVLQNIYKSFGYIFKYILFFSKNGKYILEKNHSFINNVLEIESDEIKSNFNRLVHSIDSVSCSPDGKIIASLCSNAIKLWDFSNGTLITKFLTEKASSIKFSPCGKYIAFIKSEHFISLININTKEEKKFSSGEDCDIEHFSFDATGENLRIKYSFRYIDKDEGIDDTSYYIRIYDIYKDKENNWTEYFSYNDELKYGDVCFTSDNKKVIYSNGRKLLFYDLGQPYNSAETYETSGYISSIILSNNKDFIVTVESFGYMDATYNVVIYDVATKKTVIVLENKYEYIKSITLSNSDKYLLVIYGDKNYKSKAQGNENSIIELWDFKSYAKIKTFKGHLNGITSVVFHPSEKYLISSSQDGTVKVWNIEKEEEEYTLYNFIDEEWISITNNYKFNSSKNAKKYIYVQNNPLEIMNLSEKVFNKYYQHNKCLLNQLDKSHKNEPKKDTKNILSKDDSWLSTILEWADNHNIPEKQIPRNIEELSNLEFLDLSNNNLTSIPQEFINLKNIQGLNLSNNDIRFLPKNLLLNIKNKTHVSRSYGERIVINISNNPNFHLRGNESSIICEFREDTEFYNKRKLNSIAISNYNV